MQKTFENNASLPVTVAIPTRNEEVNLTRCLQRLGRFSEIVLIDSGSTDRTIEIAQDFGVRVLNFDWDGKYPKKRNWFLMNKPPTQPWVLFLDADELVDDTFCDAVAVAIRDATKNGFWLSYTNYFMDKPLYHGLAQRKLALFRVGKGLYEKIDEDSWTQLDMEIHEHPIIDGELAEITTPIDHRDYKGLGKFIEKHRDYALWEAHRYKNIQDNPKAWLQFTGRQRFKYRHLAKWWYPWFYFSFTYFMKLGLLDGGPGFHYAAYKAWYFQTIRLLISEQAHATRSR
jgi:glycosyltransferase involved in cell wall biosynthesis